MLNNKKKTIFLTTISTIILTVLLLSSTIVMLGSSLITHDSIQANSLSPATNYGNILQYDWPNSGADEGNTGSNRGPAPDRPNVLWNVTGRGSGMVSAFNGMLFSVSGTIVYATDAFSGSLIYTSDAPGTAAPHTLNGVHKLDDTYFLTTGSAGITVRKIADGALVASQDTPNASNMAGSSGYFAGKYSSSLKMYFNHAVDPVRGNQIVAHDVSNPLSPKIAWTYAADISSETLCCGDGKVYLGSTESTVYALNRNGTRVWQTSTLGGLVQQSAIYYNGCLYTSAVSWQITCFNATTGTMLWQADKGVRAFSAYRGAAGAGMFFDATDELDPYGSIGAWDALTGERLWKQAGYFNIHYATMAYADGKLYGIKCDQAAGRITGGLKMPGSSTSCWDAYTGTELWNLPGISFSTPSIAYGNLYGISGGRLYCIGGNPADWNNGFQGNVENPRVASGQQGPIDISTPRWTYQTGGDVFSSPAVVAGKVYVGSHDQNWYCLNAFTGQKIWNYTIGHYVRTSASVAGSRVFTGADDGYFYCFDANNGSRIWRTSAGGHFPQFLDPNEAELRSSPIVVGNKVYVGSLDNKTYCLNTADGSVAWTYTTKGPITGSPTYSNNIIYIASTDSYMYALNAATGALLWRSFPLNMSISIGTTARVANYNMGTPTVGAGRVYIGGGIQYGATMTGVNYTAMNMSTPVGANGGGIRFFAFNATTGASIWNISRSGNTQPQYVPAYFNGQIYAPEFFVVSAMSATNPGAGPYGVPDFVYTNRINGNRTIGQWLGYQITGSVAYADDLTGGKIYVGCDIGSIYCLNATDLSTLSVFTAGSNIPCSPAVWDGKLYCGSNAGIIYCFDDSPAVDFNLYAAASKGAEMWNNETITIAGQLTSNPTMSVWDYDSSSYKPQASQYHPGLRNATVIVSFAKPDGSSQNVSAVTDTNGRFTVAFKPTSVGNWGWVVYYEGRRTTGLTYNAAYSQYSNVKVVAAPIAATPTPTIAPTATPTVAPSATSTVLPTATPTVAPTATPTKAPTATPTVAPTVAPTASPSPAPVDNTMTYAAVGIVVVIVVIVAAAYLLMKRKK